MSVYRIHGLQMNLAWEDPEANRARADALLQAHPPPRDALVVLPEMFNTGFSFAGDTVAEPPGGPTEEWMVSRARKHGVTLVAGLARRHPDGIMGNEALAVRPDGEVAAVYRKQRPFTPGGEHRSYPGGRDGVVFRWGALGVAPFICYDLRFPELFRAATRVARPEVFVVIASWPEPRIAHWITLLQARAIENQAYAIGVNRVGTDPTHRYVGRSLVANPSGEIIADAGTSEGVLGVELDLEALRNYRTKLPFLDDLRGPDAAFSSCSNIT